MHVKLNENEAENTLQANSLPFYTPMTPRWGQKVNSFFFLKKVHIKLKGKKCRTLCKFEIMHTPDLYGWVKTSDIEIVQKSIFFIELSELVVFDYGLSDTQDGLGCWRNGIYILWLTG